MSRIQIGGAGGAPANNFIRSLRESERDDYLIGTSSLPSDLLLADVDEIHPLPPALSPSYPGALSSLIRTAKPDFVHAQHDFEVRALSAVRDQLTEAGVAHFLPADATIRSCVDKFRSYEIWRAAGVRVPDTLLIRDAADVGRAARAFGPDLWFRATEGGGGAGALPTDDVEFATKWIDRLDGWGAFTASARLTSSSVTWSSIWFQGELVVAQGRRRRRWSFGDRALSGVTGVTGVGETCSDPVVDVVAEEAIRAIDGSPHGIFSVDMTYDADGHPNPTEINIGRFFTTHYFFTRAGLNLPKIYCDIALDGTFPTLARRVNPLPPGLVWIRGMDVEPVLTDAKALAELEARMPSDCVD